MKMLTVTLVLLVAAVAQAAGVSYTYPGSIAGISAEISSASDGTLLIKNPTLSYGGAWKALAADGTNATTNATGLCAGFGRKLSRHTVSAASSTALLALVLSAAGDKVVNGAAKTSYTLTSVTCL